MDILKMLLANYLRLKREYLEELKRLIDDTIKYLNQREFDLTNEYQFLTTKKVL